MTNTDTTWQHRARALADALSTSGDLRDPAWHAAIAAVPRHRLVPTGYQQDTAGHWASVDTATPDGLALLYSPSTLITELAERNGYQIAVSSSTKPDLMVRMLELLDVHDGHRVLEIGTGTGYNAALLAHRLGDAHVSSVDVDPALIADARRRLAGIGYHPTLAAVDGDQGYPPGAPYDRIIATCSVPRIPWPWIEQTAPDGLILADVKLGIGAGNLVLLRRNGDGAEGRFTERWAAFMAMRHLSTGTTEPAADVMPSERWTREHQTATVPALPSEQRVPWFLAHFDMPPGVTFGHRLDPATRRPTAGTVTAPDGSRVEINVTTHDGVRDVRETGPTLMWDAIDTAYETWHAADQPDWPRLGLTVTRDAQTVWLDDPDSDRRWTL
jgi:protein-L-isoaspartate(D-aspartate) O-methyltransferase